MRWLSRRACPRSWVVIRMVMPSAASAAMTSSICRVAPGSSCEEGSSRNSTSGSSAQARAMARRCCSPPDISRAGRSASAASPKRARATSARAGASMAPTELRACTMLAFADRRSMTGRWKTMAWRRPVSVCQRIAPALGASKPWQSRKVSDLPAPFGPMMAVMPPLGRVKLTSSSRRLPSASKESSRTESGRMLVISRMAITPRTARRCGSRHRQRR